MKKLVSFTALVVFVTLLSACCNTATAQELSLVQETELMVQPVKAEVAETTVIGVSCMYNPMISSYTISKEITQTGIFPGEKTRYGLWSDEGEYLRFTPYNESFTGVDSVEWDNVTYVVQVVKFVHHPHE